MSIIEQRTRERLGAAHTLQDQLAAKLRIPQTDRRKHSIPVAKERRGLNPQRKGWEDNDTETDSI
ncbi:hypothetical protein [Rhodoferax fermentans]|uniref:Uncharacterized protein n=1 Tax=Rhodoferax fermentans TaxID=28066 RepID=A0A1T1APA2_RHOFE|nr:hypothetical protein [Rhodoferax fermentans]OOV05758.1 hypothetical protein RF819_02700 [Rhodoferax fermentans]